MINATNEELDALSGKLRAAQAALLDAAARSAALPTDATVRKVADLEGAIAAIDVLMQERQPRRR